MPRPRPSLPASPSRPFGLGLGAALALALVGAACGGPSAPASAVGPDARGDAAAPTSDAGAHDADVTTTLATGYDGHGAGSVSPEVLARFRPPPLDAEVSRRIQAMLDLRAPTNALVSPDGKALFVAWNVTGTTQIWRLDGPKRFPLQLTGGEDPTTLVDVLGDGETLVVSRDRKGEENPGLYLLPAAGGPLRPVQHLPRVQTLFQFASDDGKRLYFASNDRKPDAYAIWRFDTTTGARDLVFGEDGLWSVDDHRGEKKLLLAKATGALTREYHELDLETKELLPLLGNGEREEYQAAYAREPGELVVLTNKLGDRRRLYRYRHGSAGPGFGELRPISPERDADVASFRLDRARTRITFATNEDGYTRASALDAATYKPARLPAFPGADHVVLAAPTRDGARQAALVRAPRALPRTVVIDHRAGTATPWVEPAAPEVDTTRFAVAEPSPYVARDGTSIPAFVRRSEACRRASEPCPVLVHFHGGPEGQTLPGFSPWAQIWVDAGFVLYEPNVRGSDGYGKAWLHADDGPRRLDVITDVQDAGRHVRKAFAQNGQEPRVGVFGGSYGGYATLVALTMFAGTYDAGVASVGMSNLETFLRNTAPYRRALRVSEYGDPERDRDALRKLSPLTWLDRLDAPLLLLQGASDPRVPVGEALQIHAALTARGVPAGLVVFPDEGHGTQKRENKVLEIGHTLSFFETHLRRIPPQNASSAR